jgi:hypothetical protein
MVIQTRSRTRQGWLLVDLAVAMALLLFALFPLAYSFSYEQKLCRQYYFRAVAGEIVDGEMERLAAGEWMKFPEGASELKVDLKAARNLPPGKFLVSRRGTTLHVEWRPQDQGKAAKIVRERAL